MEKYNDAIKLLHHEKYDDAIEILEELYNRYPNVYQVKWSLGLAHVLNGTPFKALIFWKSITEDQISKIDYFRNKVEVKLPKYKEIYEAYNQAIESIKESDFKTANTILMELLPIEEEVPLPINVYQGYILSLILTENYVEASAAIKPLPSRVKKDVKIESIDSKLNSMLHDKTAGHSKRSKNRFGILYGAGIAAAIGVGAFATNLLIDTQTTTVASEENNQIDEIEKYGLQITELEETIEKLNKTQRDYEEQLFEKNQLIEEQSTVQEMLSKADMNLTTIAIEAGRNSYYQGIREYRNKNFEGAIVSFKESLDYSPDQYFSDDAMYFLINAESILAGKTDIYNMYDQFLLNKNDHYRSSPYYDDLLLAKAEYLVSTGKLEEAKSILADLQNLYPNEWTGKRSVDIQMELTEEENAGN